MDGTNHMSMDHANHEHANHMHHMNMDHMMPPDHEMPLNSTFENDIITNAINSSEDNLDYNSDLRSHAHHGHGGLNAHAGHEIHGDHSMGNHDMAMTFHGGYAETILFSWWKVTDVGEFIGSFFAVFLMALLYEGLKYYRKHLLWKTYTGLQYCAVSPPDKGVSNICTPDEPQVIQTDQKQCYSVNGFAYRFTINKVFNLITDESAFDAALGSASQLTSPQIKTNQYVIEYQRSEFTAIQKPVPHVLERNIPTMMSTAHAWQTILHGVQVLVSYMLMLVFMSYNTWLCAAVVLGSATGYFLFGWRESVVVDFTEHCH